MQVTRGGGRYSTVARARGPAVDETDEETHATDQPAPAKVGLALNPRAVVSPAKKPGGGATVLL